MRKKRMDPVVLAFFSDTGSGPINTEFYAPTRKSRNVNLYGSKLTICRRVAATQRNAAGHTATANAG